MGRSTKMGYTRDYIHILCYNKPRDMIYKQAQRSDKALNLTHHPQPWEVGEIEKITDGISNDGSPWESVELG